jgi:DNA-binding NarL/FixJ family response regulator
LASAFDRAAAGSGSVVAVLGDSGIGKTRLLEELEQLAKGRGALVLAGRAWAMHMRLAYALLVDALGTHLRELTPSDRERLVDDLPELDNLFVELPRRALAPLNDPELEKTRLFEAVSRLVERLAGSRTVVLKLDDVQWADLASIEMLHYLCRNVRRARILVALTIRKGEPEPNARLNDLLHSLGGAGLLVRIELGRLSDEESLAMTRLLLQGDLSPSLESLITSRTRGVPLLVDELVRSLLASSHLRRELTWKAEPSAAQHLPSAVRELIDYRLSRVDTVDRSLLEMLAVDGEGMRAAELAAVCHLTPEEVDDRLARLARERLVVTDEKQHAPRFILGHALMQQALLNALGANGRARLHHELLRMLESIAGQDIGRLARHHIGAGPQTASARSLEVVTAAAEHAVKVHAPAEAASLYAAAVELARGLNRDDALPDLLAQLGSARIADGDPTNAVASWREAAKHYQARGERTRSFALYPQIALAMSARGQNAQALDLLREAAAEAPAEIGVRLAEADVMIRDSMGDIETLDIAVDELRRRAEELGQPEVAVTAKRIEAWLCVSRVECPRAWELLTEALEAARTVGTPLALFNVLCDRLFLAMSLGDIDAVEKNAAEATEVARTQLRSARLITLAAIGLLAVDWVRGEWRRAAERVPPLFEMSLRAGDNRFAIGLLYGQAQVAALSGDAEQARMYLDEAKRQRAERPLEMRIELQRYIAEGDLKMLEGDYDGAIASFEQACGPRPGQLMRTEFPVNSLARLANAYIAAKRFDAALDCARALDGNGPMGDGQAWRIRGLVKGPDGVPELERALPLLRTAQIANEIAECCVALAENLANARRAEAVELAVEALALGEKTGAAIISKRARACLDRLAATAAASVPRTAQVQGARSEPSLTAREREVAVLISHGLTNDEIARSLHISPHTVATHVKRMYDRLGVASRVELTRYVLDHRLGDTL